MSAAGRRSSHQRLARTPRALGWARLRSSNAPRFQPEMPRNPKYPLTPLREHRDRKVEAATAELGGAVRAREAADESKRAAERTRQEAEARAAAVRNEEAERLGRGELRAGDLARAQAWEYAAHAEMTDLTHAVDRAAGHVDATREAEGAARAALAQDKADRDVVVKDQARFDHQALRVRDAAEEEAAEEVFAARIAKGSHT